MPGHVAKGNSPLSGVHCSVNSCYYWQHGNHCYAQHIEVQPPNATDSEQTDCATFAPKA